MKGERFLSDIYPDVAKARDELRLLFDADPRGKRLETVEKIKEVFTLCKQKHAALRTKENHENDR